MVRDFIVDMKERDLMMEDKSSISIPVYNTLWGNVFDEDEEQDVLICNVLIPQAYWPLIKYDEDNGLTVYFKTSYIPDTRNFRVRLLAMKDGQYNLFENVRGDFGFPVNSYAMSRNIAAPISACALPYVDLDGEFVVRIIPSSREEIVGRAYIYSAKQSDITVNYSDNQASQLLTLCAPGKSYRYPTTGVGVTRYLNSVIDHSNLDKILEEQFDADGKPIVSADFDNTTCNLDIIATPEEGVNDTNLSDVAYLNVDFFSRFTDDFVRRNVVIDTVVDTEFFSTLDEYESVVALVMFVDESTTSNRIMDNVIPGRFDSDGNIVSSTEYYIISATLEAGTIIMFDDETEDKITDSPVFIINNTDESRLYTALVEQPYWIEETCHKCFILKRRAEIKYMIRREQFNNGKGLYIIPQVSSNIKNMVGLVQDIHTGRMLGIVSTSTNISDIILDEITQHIYATQID